MKEEKEIMRLHFDEVEFDTRHGDLAIHFTDGHVEEGYIVKDTVTFMHGYCGEGANQRIRNRECWAVLKSSVKRNGSWEMPLKWTEFVKITLKSSSNWEGYSEDYWEIQKYSVEEAKAAGVSEYV